MVIQTSNTCERCGGSKTFTFVTGDIISLAESTFKFCMCRSEQEKHDGILDDQGKLQVSLSFGQVWIQGEYEAILEPSQALSLLAYLKQEQATLERLAEEQTH